MLDARGLTAGYGSQPVIHDIDLIVEPGEVVAILGANGVGKTTTLLTLAGELPAMSGQVLMDGVPATGPLHRRANRGLGFVTEERSIFKTLSTKDNLRAADVRIEDALEVFPELERRLGVRAGLLSGGEQQMLTLARALARRPRLLLADELTLGLAPRSADRMLAAARAAADQRGTSVVLVEQHVQKALRYSDRAYVMQRGRIVLSASSAELVGRVTEIQNAYFAT